MQLNPQQYLAVRGVDKYDLTEQFILLPDALNTQATLPASLNTPQSIHAVTDVISLGLHT